MVLRQVHDHWHQHGEGLFLVRLEDVEEVVILEEAHGAVTDLQVISADGLDNALEELWNEGLHFLHVADLEHLAQLCEEEGLLHGVGKGPVLEQTLKEWDGQVAVLRQEQHGAPEQLLVELTASLHLVEWDDDRLEEGHVLVTQGHGEARDDARQDVEQLSGTIELVVLLDERVEGLVHCLSDHLSAGHQL